MTFYNAWPTTAGFTRGSAAFCGGGYAAGHVYMTPYGASHAVKVNLTTGAMKALPWPSGHTKGSAYFEGAVVTHGGRYVWLVPEGGGADSVMRIDTTTDAMTRFNTWPSGFVSGVQPFNGAVYDQQRIWLVPYLANQVVSMDTGTGSTTRYVALPSGMTFITALFAGGAFDGRYVWMAPYNARKVVKLDPLAADGSMQGFDNWPTPLPENGAFYGGAFDGKRFWMCPRSNYGLVGIDVVRM